MTEAPPARKIFKSVASRKKMFELFNRVPDCSPEELISGIAYQNQWFEIQRDSYESMFELFPPLFMRAGMFAFSELKSGSVGSVFFEIMINGRNRWFHAYCDHDDGDGPERLRAAIIEHERAVAENMTREEKLQLIWSSTSRDYRGLAGEANPDAWPAEHLGKRTIMVLERPGGTVLKLLEDLTDDEIADRLPHGPTI
ncbi:uncharacterized protein DUF1419 [Hephaestia caeni]|uniref:Uncharacterized protein DUF1419 n=1 Tax=Hephaestia caeni TaxID=645617 RepID=A0A397PCM6_9SPHN|nr:DUF1419 domain-containing protein [Hephaestia caeni]RIA46183.1 uncharacterized protein DUF1419 [Hephaestia caeni]